ncbi:MAG: LacI family transcriptional regulator, partial [Bifidobacteriales bacterium]|nr:LacI family transcriptional regulator [Bifidobacteriales bacterium]
MNIKDIAKLAGVSTSTVSKIVNHKDSSITEATRSKVLDLVKKYHYTPYASSKPNTTSWRIGVLLSSSISLDSTLDGIIQQAQASGYGTLVFNSYSNQEQEEQNIQAAIEHRVDGIIWEPIDKSSLKLN